MASRAMKNTGRGSAGNKKVANSSLPAMGAYCSPDKLHKIDNSIASSGNGPSKTVSGTVSK